MVLPANNVAKSISDINVELGAVGNSSVASTNILRSLNEDAVRRLAPGPGKTISTTSGAAISFDDLSSAYLREYLNRTVNSGLYRVGSEACDEAGNIYSLWTITTASGPYHFVKYNPQSNVIIWARTIAFNNARGSSFTGLNNSSTTINVGNNGKVFVRVTASYQAKYIFYYPLIVAFDKDGTFLWQTLDLYSTSNITAASISFKPDLAIYNNDGLILQSGNITIPSTLINLINASSGAVIANVALNITNYTTVQLYSCGGKPTQSNVYTVGSATNTNIFGVITQINTSGGINWIGRLTNSNTFVHDVTVGSDGSPYFVSRQASLPSSIFIIKTNSGGSVTWSRQITYPSNNTPVCLLSDTSDNLYAVSYAAANTTANGALFVSSLSSSGTSRWHRRVTSGSTANAFYEVGIPGRPNITGNRLLVPMCFATAANDAVWHANTGGPTTGTYLGYAVSTITPTVGSTNATGYTSLTTLSGSLTGANTTLLPNLNISTTTTNPITITNIT